MALPYEEYKQLLSEEIATAQHKIKHQEMDLAALRTRLDQLNQDREALERLPDIARRFNQSREVYDRT